MDKRRLVVTFPSAGGWIVWLKTIFEHEHATGQERCSCERALSAPVAELTLGIMMEILTILIGAFDLASMVLAAVKYWRISCGFLAAASAMVMLCFVTSSPAIRWIVGFHVFVLIVTAAIFWEQRRGKLRE